MDRDFECSLMADNFAHPHNRRKSVVVHWASSPNDWLIRCDVGQVLTIDVLPDDVLLIIFGFYVVGYEYPNFIVFSSQCNGMKNKIRSWHSLVHVCRRWRDIVFGSPRHLNLQLCCTTTTPARETLDVWPAALPLLIQGCVVKTSVDNVIAELEQSNRICQINLHLTLLIEKLWTAMEVPFPELAILYLSHQDLSGVSPPIVLSDSFLGGSAPPRLRILGLNAIRYSISGITQTTFICHSPRRTKKACKCSSFGVHLTRRDGHLPLHLDQPRNSSTRFPIPSQQGKPMSASTHTFCPPLSRGFPL